ncbi:MAG: NAD(P)H-dependent oxidoreductase [Pseudomonadota bacterium]
MLVSVILAHPNVQSFNHAIAQTAVKKLQQLGHQVVFHDLYDEAFPPVLPNSEIPEDAHLSKEVELHCREIYNTDGIIIIHPNWWGQPPAILKGWIDRVIRPGVAYRFVEGDQGEGVPVGLLKARVALVFNTSNTPAEREAKVFGDPLETLWKKCIFGLCGIQTVYRRIFGIIVTSTLEQRLEWLSEVRDIVGRYLPGD